MGFSTGGSGNGSIAGGADVALSNPATNQVLVYNSTSSKWVNGTDNKTIVSVGGVAQSTLNIDPTPVTIATLGAEAAGLSSATWSAIQAAISAAIANASSNGTISPDTTAPTGPGAPSVTAGAGSISLTWTASTDNIGVTGYNIYRSDNANSIIGVAAGTTYVDYSVVPTTSYTYTVKAKDAAGNLSVASTSSAAVAATAAVTATNTSRYTSDTFSNASSDIIGRSTQPTSSGGLSATWTGPTAGTLGVNNGQIVHGATNAIYFAGLLEPALSMEFGFTLVSLPVGDKLTVQIHRQAADISNATNAYSVSISTSGVITMFKTISGTVTSLGSITGGSAAAGDVFAFRYTGGTLSLSRNGTSINSVSDTSITTAGYAGFSGSASNTGVGISNVYIDGISITGATYVQDLFNIANGPLTTAETGQAWTTLSGTWAISGDKVVQSTGSGVVIINTGVANMAASIQLVYQSPAATGVVGVIVLASDINNMITFVADNQVLKLYKYDTGTKTTLATGPSFTTANGQANIYNVVVMGSLITCYIDNIARITYTMSSAEVTKYTAYTEAGLFSTGYSATLFDNFTARRIA